MAKIPYLVRRKNVFYFRLSVPADLREIIKSREIIQSLRTQNYDEATRKALTLAAHFKALLHELRTGKRTDLNRSNSNSMVTEAERHQVEPSQVVTLQTRDSLTIAPRLSIVVDDFLKRYDPRAKIMLGKLNATLPILVELVGDKLISEILQTDINQFFDAAQLLPVRRDAAQFKGLPIRKIIESNTCPTISEKTFKSTYRACVSVFLNWATVHYKDQGFPTLSVDGAVYRGARADGINKQRAMRPEELQKLFGHPKMKKFASSPKTSHYWWLPLIGLYTGARINEICQLNPQSDINQDKLTGIYYFHFTDEGEAAEGVDKSIKTDSSERIVPIHSRLLELGFLEYVDTIKRNGHKMIFPAWAPRNGKASANASKWFIRFIEKIGLRDDTIGARLSGFHSFRHTFITHGMTNKITGVFAITGHETEVIDGFGAVTAVAKGYWTRGLLEDILFLKETVDKFEFNIPINKPVM